MGSRLSFIHNAACNQWLWCLSVYGTVRRWKTSCL